MRERGTTASFPDPSFNQSGCCFPSLFQEDVCVGMHVIFVVRTSTQLRLKNDMAEAAEKYW